MIDIKSVIQSSDFYIKSNRLVVYWTTTVLFIPPAVSAVEK